MSSRERWICAFDGVGRLKSFCRKGLTSIFAVHLIWACAQQA